MRILVTGTRAPAALHMARLLAHAGHDVLTADAVMAPLCRGETLFVDRLRYPSPRRAPAEFRAWVVRTLRDENIELIVPCCEEIFHFAHVLEDIQLNHLLYGPSLEMLLKCHDKYAFTQMMWSVGLPHPHTQLLTSPEDLADLDTSKAVLKPVWSRFGHRTLIRPTEAEAQGITPTAQDPWVIQEFIPGQEISIYGISGKGRATALCAYKSDWRVGGGGICLTPVYGDDIEAFVHTFASRTQWTGQFAFDAIRCPDRGLIPIECNPRATSGLHFFRNPASFSGALFGNNFSVPSPKPQCLRPAMMSFGLSQALRTKQLSKWRDDFSSSEDAQQMGSDRTGAIRSLATMIELSLRAAVHRVSLLEASTYDIAWDGTIS
jgi:hypothetical protein